VRSCEHLIDDVRALVPRLSAADGASSLDTVMASARSGTTRDLGSLVEQGLTAALSEIPDLLRSLCGEALGVIDIDGRAVTRGKRLRPLLCLHVCDTLARELGDALLSALAVECVHAFSLVHDDIADGDRERRGSPALWVRAGTGQAINAGDVLMAEGLGLAWRAGPWAAALIHTATVTLIGGQQLDLSAEGTITPSIADWEQLAALKTGALFAASSAAGAAAAGVDDAQVEGFWRLGNRLGLAFQARDDILGIWGDAIITGKPVGSDLRRRKSSLPVAVALDGAGSDVAGALQDPHATVEQRLEILEASGAHQRALEVEHSFRDQVWMLLAELIPAGPAGDALRSFVAAILDRER
jgi:geranylgeranyl diphosphate synthase, type I